MPQTNNNRVESLTFNISTYIVWPCKTNQKRTGVHHVSRVTCNNLKLQDAREEVTEEDDSFCRTIKQGM